jgi:hypothetical protein
VCLSALHGAIRFAAQRVFSSGFWPQGARCVPIREPRGHITVNGRVVDIPSYQCRAGDVIAVRERKASRLLAESNLAFPGISNIPKPGTRQAEVHRQSDQQVRAGMGGPRDQRTAGGGILQLQSLKF